MIPDMIVRAEVDAEGVLMSCDPALAQLQRAAGGSAMGPIVVPHLARMVRGALAMATPVSQEIIVAGADADLRIWARVMPSDDGAQIELSDWREIAARGPSPFGPGTGEDIEAAADPDGIAFQLDERLAIVSVALDTREAAAWAGRSVSELFRLQPDDDGYFPLLSAFAIEEPFDGQEAIASAGPARDMVLHGEPMLDGEGVFVGYRGLALVQPGTERPDDDAMPLNALGARAGDFSRRIDGAMRRPLGRIIANAETIHGKLEGPIRQDYANYAGDIAAAGRHLMGLIDDLADLQAIERADFVTACEDVDLADLGRRAAGLLAMKARERDIRIDAPDADENVVAVAEFRRALQILLNLVGNAIRYSPEGSMIWIRAEREGSEARITVADQGAGLDEAQQARLFHKFERLGRTDAGGSGLGLYIARKLARAMGGDIAVESAPGQGARFTLTLPAKD